MSSFVQVEHHGGDRFAIAIRQHQLFVDQPVGDGGTDTAPTPTELFVGSLASCVAFYAGRFLVRHGLTTNGLAVTATFTMATRPSRVGEIALRISVPAGVPDERRAGLLAVASSCTVHHSLQHAPDVHIELAP